MIFGYIFLGLIFCHILYVQFIVKPTWQANDFDQDFEEFKNTLWNDRGSLKQKEWPQEEEQNATYEVISSTPKKTK